MRAPDTSPARVGVGTYVSALLFAYVGSFYLLVFVPPVANWLKRTISYDDAWWLRMFYAPLIEICRQVGLHP